MSEIIEVEPGTQINVFYDRMLEYVKLKGTKVYGVFNGQLFAAYANAKEYSDIECFGGKYNPAAEKKPKKVFISQPMRGKTDEEILAEKDRAVIAVVGKLGEPVKVIDSFFNDAPATAAPLWFIAKSLEALAEADIVYFCSGWDTARGCKIEHQCAVEYGIERIYAN